MPHPQTTDTVLMVRPARFGANPETAATNAFQRPGPSAEGPGPAALARRAAEQFDGLAHALREAGVTVHVLPAAGPSPDACFPNNWCSTHASGLTVLYPMQSPLRRTERDAGALMALAREHGLRTDLLVDLSAHEAEDRFLEGTGSLVIDRLARRAYACRSPRTDEVLARAWGRHFAHRVEAFDAAGPDGAPVYHTNVVMHLGEREAVVCLEAVAARDRTRLLRTLQADGKDPIPIGADQMAAYAANLLELRGAGDRRFTVLSRTAHDALDAAQRRALERHTTLLAAPLDAIEALGGGSARCMLAELFWPPAKA
jgi:hypothetical protein